MAESAVHTPTESRPASPGLALTRDRAHALVIVGAIVAHLAHQWMFRLWYIEDSAICFAMARNIVAGEGVVPWAGGERIEAYSNPLWMLLLVAWQVVGVEGWVSSKIMAAVFGSATLPLAWLVAREAMPEGRDGRGTSALFAPILLAASSHHAIWSASALENSLFNFLLVLGSWLLLREDGRGARFPWSALVFFALGVTRPEGVLYAAVAGCWWMCFALERGRGLRPALIWATTFWIPYAAFEAWRIWYFAWPLPNTYYAKLGESTNPLLRYYSRGWDQLRQYAQATWSGYYLPLFPLALLGARGRRGRLAAVVAVVVVLALLVPGPAVLRELRSWPDLPEPKEWLQTRIWLLTAVAFLLPFVAIRGADGWRARALTWHLGVVAMFFSVYSDGDWMRGLRWMSLFAPAQAILLAVGIDELLGVLPRLTREPKWGTSGWIVGTLIVAAWVPPNLGFSRWYDDQKDDWPHMIKRRADYTTWFADRIFLDERVRALDMDMGAHLWWTDQVMVDMAGLVDVPMSIHDYQQRDFIQEYVYDEQRPHYAHVHLRWSELSNYKSYPEWDDTFFQMRGYLDGNVYHDGVFARRDLMMQPTYEQPVDRTAGFARGVRLGGFDLPNPEVGQGRAMFVEVAFGTEFRREADDDFTVTMFLSDGEGNLASWDLPMGYGLYPIAWWREGELFRGRFAVGVPAKLPTGTYDLGFVVYGGRGYALAAGGPEGELPVAPGAVVGGAGAEPAHLARGELRFPDAVTVVSSERIDQLADEKRLAALQQARDGACDDAEQAWIRAKRHLPYSKAWHEKHEPEVGRALSRCLARQAADEPERRVALLARAHTWDHRNREFVRAAEAVADELYAEGKAARAAGDWERAYRLFSDVLEVAPYYSWARRYAEEARDHRLGLYEEQSWGGSFGPW